VTAIGAALQHPERLAGLHFFNPAPLMALVEIVSGLATDKAVADTLLRHGDCLGQVGGACQVDTRLHRQSRRPPVLRRGAASGTGRRCRLRHHRCRACREAGGFRMGPFELMDMIGHDVNFAVTNSVWRAFYNDQRFLPSLIQQELVDAGFFGRKRPGAASTITAKGP
jgi:3-hydroxybutyryl-CoA dehydrogenase